MQVQSSTQTIVFDPLIVIPTEKQKANFRVDKAFDHAIDLGVLCAYSELAYF